MRLHSYCSDVTTRLYLVAVTAIQIAIKYVVYDHHYFGVKHLHV